MWLQHLRTDEHKQLVCAEPAKGREVLNSMRGQEIAHSKISIEILMSQNEL